MSCKEYIRISIQKIVYLCICSCTTIKGYTRNWVNCFIISLIFVDKQVISGDILACCIQICRVITKVHVVIDTRICICIEQSLSILDFTSFRLNLNKYISLWWWYISKTYYEVIVSSLARCVLDIASRWTDFWCSIGPVELAAYWCLCHKSSHVILLVMEVGNDLGFHGTAYHEVITSLQVVRIVYHHISLLWTQNFGESWNSIAVFQKWCWSSIFCQNLNGLQSWCAGCTVKITHIELHWPCSWLNNIILDINVNTNLSAFWEVRDDILINRCWRYAIYSAIVGFETLSCECGKTSSIGTAYINIEGLCWVRTIPKLSSWL